MTTIAKILGDKDPFSPTITGLGSMVHGEGQATDSQITPSDQTTINGYLYMDMALDATWTLAPSASNTADVYIIHSDGVREQEYTTGSSAVGPSNGFVGSFVVHDTDTDQELFLPNVLVPAKDFRVMVINNTGGAFSAASLYITPHTEQGV